MPIRKAQTRDIPEILKVYRAAKDTMIRRGNPTQWEEGYPACCVPEDIAQGSCYVEQDDDGVIHGVFVCILGDDPTYRVITQGRWLNTRPYAAIHRVGSDGQMPGLFARCVAFCRRLCPELRADTHADNHVMQRLLEETGFRRCGCIRIRDGSPRIAYQLLTRKEEAPCP